MLRQFLTTAERSFYKRFTVFADWCSIVGKLMLTVKPSSLHIVAYLNELIAIFAKFFAATVSGS